MKMNNHLANKTYLAVGTPFAVDYPPVRQAPLAPYFDALPSVSRVQCHRASPGGLGPRIVCQVREGPASSSNPHFCSADLSYKPIKYAAPVRYRVHT